MTECGCHWRLWTSALWVWYSIIVLIACYFCNRIVDKMFPIKIYCCPTHANAWWKNLNIGRWNPFADLSLLFFSFSKLMSHIKWIDSLAGVNLHIILSNTGKFEYIVMNWKVEPMKMMPSGTEKESRNWKPLQARIRVESAMDWHFIFFLFRFLF